MAVLGIPAALLQPPYRRALAAGSTWALHLFGEGFRIREVSVQQPLHIAMFVALCLATRGVSRRKLATAVMAGVPILAVLGLEVIVVVSAGFDVLRRSGATVASPAPRALAALIDGLPWVAAPLLWLSLLGGSWIERQQDPASPPGSRSRSVRPSARRPG